MAYLALGARGGLAGHQALWVRGALGYMGARWLSQKSKGRAHEKEPPDARRLTTGPRPRPPGAQPPGAGTPMYRRRDLDSLNEADQREILRQLLDQWSGLAAGTKLPLTTVEDILSLSTALGEWEAGLACLQQPGPRSPDFARKVDRFVHASHGAGKMDVVLRALEAEKSRGEELSIPNLEAGIDAAVEVGGRTMLSF
jgi:hypothetical protein